MILFLQGLLQVQQDLPHTVVLLNTYMIYGSAKHHQIR